MRPGTSRLLRFAAIAAAAFCIALSGVADARPLTLIVTPPAPTWQDALHLRVEGVVQTSCGAGVRLANLRSSAQGVDVDLVQDACDVQTPPVAVPFSVEVELGRMKGLALGTFVANVHDLADGGLATTQFKVYYTGRVALDVPAVAVSGEPIEIGVNHRDECFYIFDHHVAGNVIEVISSVGCQIYGEEAVLDRTPVVVGPLAPGDYEVRVFENQGGALTRLPLRVWDAAGCVPADERLCLQHGRFQVSARWRTFDGTTGSAHAAPLDGDEGSGLLWFFAPDNTELTVKVVEGCPVNQRWWAFVSSSSTVEYEVTVTDTRSGATRTYTNALGQVPELLADTGAFPCP